MKSLVALVVLVVIGLIVSLMMRLGAFKQVALKSADLQPMQIVYKHHVGAYHKIVPVIEDVEKWVKANGERCDVSFGEYIDNPDQVAEDRLRSNGGCVVLKKPVSMPDGFFFREIPAHQFVVADFDGAPSIGPLKVYPAAKKFMTSSDLTQTGPTFELYRILPSEQVHTTYLFPVMKNGATDSNPVAEDSKH